MGLARTARHAVGQPGFKLVRALSHSGRWRGLFCEQMTFGHLAGALHEILTGLGGTPRVAGRSDGHRGDPTASVFNGKL